MATVTFDTLKFVETLKAAGFDEPQAKGMSAAIQEVQKANLEELAAKRDLKELESQLSTKADVAKMETHIQEVKRDIRELESTMDAKLAAMELRIIKWVIGSSGIVVALIKLLPGGH